MDVVESDWIVPPFILDRSGFVAGGPFRRAGKISIPFDPEKIAVLGDSVVYQPRIARFVPDFEDLNSGGVSGINGGYDTSSWSIKMWVGGVGVRPASSEERQFPHVPWETFSLALLDLWLEQFRCCQLGESIPSEISKPEGEITF
ncbi:hypothetical protein [Corynebacterium cystitidis]|uniref:hypothetical protein n=1 Tax=Corynebacterium cystitidis TaxID=35757 RepID=UPI00115FC884|nr:hypothetical protein [Corynebacterium cystitidis]